MIKVLVNTYSPLTGTSYGIICRELWTRLVSAGIFKVEQLAWINQPLMPPVSWKLHSTKVTTEGNVRRIDTEDVYGQQSLEQLVVAIKPDVVWSMGDPYMVNHVAELSKKHRFKNVLWTLQCGSPTADADAEVIRKTDATVGMTMQACQEWEAKIGGSFNYIPAGVSGREFSVVSPEEKYAIRRDFSKGAFTKEDFVLLYVGKNQDRKRPWNYIAAVKFLSQGNVWVDSLGNFYVPQYDFATKRMLPPTVRVPNLVQLPAIPVKLWMHTPAPSKYNSNNNFVALADQWDLPKGSMILTDGLKDMAAILTKDMAALYQMSDLCMMASGAEGFGVPIIEAAACGVRSVCTDYSAVGEVGRNCDGIMIPPASYNPGMNTLGGNNWVANVSIADLCGAIYTAYTKRELVDQQALRKNAITRYEWGSVALSWAELIRNISYKEKPVLYGEEV